MKSFFIADKADLRQQDVLHLKSAAIMFTTFLSLDYIAKRDEIARPAEIKKPCVTILLEMGTFLYLKSNTELLYHNFAIYFD